MGKDEIDNSCPACGNEKIPDENGVLGGWACPEHDIFCNDCTEKIIKKIRRCPVCGKELTFKMELFTDKKYRK